MLWPMTKKKKTNKQTSLLTACWFLVLHKEKISYQYFVLLWFKVIFLVGNLDILIPKTNFVEDMQDAGQKCL